MYAVKANRQYAIAQADAAAYQAQGYDILDEEFRLVRTGEGKTVSAAAYGKLEAQLKAARAELAALRAGTRGRKPPEG